MLDLISTSAGMQDGPDMTVVHEETLVVPLTLGGPTGVHLRVAVSASYLTTIDWSLFGRPYTFNVHDCRSGSINKLLTRFHEHKDRDEGQYGRIDQDLATGNRNMEMNVRQRVSTWSRWLLTCYNL